MARNFLTPINLNKLELQNVALQNLASDPGTPVAGQIYYNTGGTVKYYNGSSWITFSTGAGSFYLGTTSISLGNSSGSVTAVAGLSTINGISIASSGAGSTGTFLTSSSTASVLTSVGTLTGLTMGGAISLQSTTGSDGYKITGLADPTSNYDAVNKKYVDNVATGVNAHDAVKYATTGALGTTGNLVGGTITTTYANGTSGVGATLTIATSTNWTAITIDGQSLTVGDRVLIKNQAAALQNGIYTVTSVGTVGTTTSFVFTRATDSDQTPELGPGDLVYVLAGTSNGGNGFIQTATVTTIGTDAVNWTQFSGPSTTLAGLGLVPNGTNPNQIDVGTASTARIVVNADNIDLATVSVGTTGSGSASGSIVQAITVDSYGRVTNVQTGTHTLAAADGTTKGIATFSSTYFSAVSGVVSLSSLGSLNTLGSAAKWTTTRSLAGNSVDGSIDVAFSNKFIVQGTTDAGLSGAQFLGALGTGIVKNTTTTGVLSIAVAADFPVLNQNTTGTAAGLSGTQTANTVYAAPSGSSGTASFRALTYADLPTNVGVVARKVTAVGTGTGTSIALTHGLGSNLVTAQVYDTSTSTATLVDVDITVTSTTATATFASSTTLSNYTLVVVG